MKLIVGLGNPGGKYASNRHNVGFMAVDLIHAEYDFQPWRKRFSGEVSEGRIGRDKCLLIKPLTYMNESGRSIGEALRFYKLDLEDVIVLYDEIDLAAGKLKIKSGGGNAGHNGLRSLSSHIGNDYQRVRIGVGRPAQKSQVANYVLRDFSKSDRDWLEPLLEAITRFMPVLLEHDAGRFLGDIATRLAPLSTKQDGKSEAKKGAKKPAAAGAGKGSGGKSQKKAGQQLRKKPEQGADEGPLAHLLKSWKTKKNKGEDQG